MEISIEPVHDASLRYEAETRAAHREAYRFFDVTIGLRSDDRDVIETFSEIYGRFRTCGDAQAEYCVLTGDRLFGGPALVADGEVHRLSSCEALAGYVHMVLARSFMRRVRSHLLIHAAALSWRDVGVVLPSFSGGGKTTLALELVRRGFSLLSDEIAAIGCADHLLYPFPRALGVREGTWALFGEEARRAVRELRTVTGEMKSTLRMEEVGAPEGRTCPLRLVVLLDGGNGSDERGEEGLFVVVHRLGEDLLSGLARIPGIRCADRFRDEPFPIVRLDLEADAYVGAEVAEVCARHHTVVFAMVRDDERTPDFRRRPRVQPLSVSAAATALAQRFQGGADSAVLRGRYNGRVAGMVWELTEVLEDAACYRLSPGRLEEMADILCALVRGIV